MRILRFCFVIAFFYLTASCNTGISSKNKQADADTSGRADLPVMTFDAEKHDFGTIKEGEKAAYFFVFKNTGKSNLIISSAQGSCGCTVPEYPKEPVVPGEEGVIKVTFDSHGKPGFNKKEVLIVTNCKPSTKILQIQANVVPLEAK